MAELETLLVKEIYRSVQGESSYAGLPCTFIRLSGCPLRCRWCDTVYGFKGGEQFSTAQIIEQIKELGVNLVELTGGEPLAQAEAFPLLQALNDQGFKVLLETSGSIDIEPVDPRTHVIMDLKCPDSKMSQHNLLSNFKYLKPSDEIKFVIASRSDFDWACMITQRHELDLRFKVLASPAWGLVEPKDLVTWILESRQDMRLNLQLHKYIWSPKAKGV